MQQRQLRIVGWVLSVLLAAFMAFSASGKFVDFPDKEKMFAEMGWKVDVMQTIGIVEIVIAVLYLIPPTAFVGAVLLTAYLGGAVATHVRVDQAFYFPIIVGVLVWIAYGLRTPALWSLALGRSSSAAPGP